MIDIYEEKGGNVVAVMEVPLSHVSSYGIIDVESENNRLLSIRGMVEKPMKENAPSNLVIIGRYILHPDIFIHLEKQRPGVGGEIQLTDAMIQMLGKHPFHGYRFDGRRFDCGEKSGMVIANLNIALEHKDLKDEVILEIQRILKLHRS